MGKITGRRVCGYSFAFYRPCLFFPCPPRAWRQPASASLLCPPTCNPSPIAASSQGWRGWRGSFLPFLLWLWLRHGRRVLGCSCFLLLFRQLVEDWFLPPPPPPENARKKNPDDLTPSRGCIFAANSGDVLPGGVGDRLRHVAARMANPSTSLRPRAPSRLVVIDGFAGCQAGRLHQHMRPDQARVGF